MRSQAAFLAVGSYTDDEMLIKVIQAQHIHQAFGISLWPWEVGEQVPEDWLAAIDALIMEVPKRTPHG